MTCTQQSRCDDRSPPTGISLDDQIDNALESRRSLPTSRKWPPTNEAPEGIRTSSLLILPTASVFWLGPSKPLRNNQFQNSSVLIVCPGPALYGDVCTGKVGRPELVVTTPELFLLPSYWIRASAWDLENVRERWSELGRRVHGGSCFLPVLTGMRGMNRVGR